MFWKKKPLKVFFQEDHNQILKDIIPHFDRTFNIREADRFVLWTDTTIDSQGIIDYARHLKKKTIVLQHGRRGSGRYFPPFNFPIQADKLLVWGSKDKEALVEAGHPEAKIKVCGTTLWKHFKGLERRSHEGINIVFSPEHWDRELTENKKVSQILKKACRENKWNLTTKIIEGHDPKLYKNPISSNRADESHFKIIADVLSTADLVVGISESTFELIAQYLDIPVVIVEDWIPKTFGGDERYYTYRRVISEASAKARYGNLEKVIKQQLSYPEELSGNRGYIVADEGGTELNPLEAILKEIKQ